MTISPPYKVKIKNINDFKVKILTSGFDRLILSADVKWSDESLFQYFKGLKEKAKADNKETPGSLGKDENMKWLFNMNPSGAKGWEWLLKGQEFTLTIGDWLVPISRPSMMIDIGSETLWRVGARDSIDYILNLINSKGGKITTVKPSRVDICADVLMPNELWTDELKDYIVTRARKFTPYYDDGRLTGMMIGRGSISARLYDKFFEIIDKSKKLWMFPIWNLENFPGENEKVIRVEFQLRREALKEVNIDSLESLFGFVDNLWAYCTKNWLKFQDRPGTHHTQRETFDWWTQIQNGFMGIQEATPLIRNKAIKIKIEQLMSQIFGLSTSLEALEMELNNLDIFERRNFKDAILSIFSNIEKISKTDNDFNNEVLRKRSGYHRAMTRMIQVREKQTALGFPTDKGSGKRIH
jgi:hypothetical protein